MDIKNMISIADTEPDFLTIFGETKYQIYDSRHAKKLKIKDLMIRASNKIWFQEASLPTIQQKHLNLTQV